MTRNSGERGPPTTVRGPPSLANARAQACPAPETTSNRLPTAMPIPASFGIHVPTTMRSREIGCECVVPAFAPAPELARSLPRVVTAANDLDSRH